MLSSKNRIQFHHIVRGSCHTLECGSLQFCTKNITLGHFHFMLLKHSILVEVTFFEHSGSNYCNNCLWINSKAVAPQKILLFKLNVRSMENALILVDIKSIG